MKMFVFIKNGGKGDYSLDGPVISASDLELMN